MEILAAIAFQGLIGAWIVATFGEDATIVPFAGGLHEGEPSARRRDPTTHVQLIEHRGGLTLATTARLALAIGLRVTIVAH